MKYPTVEETWHVPLSLKEAFDQEAIGYAKFLKEAKEAAEKHKEVEFTEGKPSTTVEPWQMLPRKTSKQKAWGSITSFKEGRVE